MRRETSRKSSRETTAEFKLDLAETVYLGFGTFFSHDLHRFGGFYRIEYREDPTRRFKRGGRREERLRPRPTTTSLEFQDDPEPAGPGVYG